MAENRTSADVTEPVTSRRDGMEAAYGGTHAVALIPLLIVAAGIVAYANSLAGPFVFDDAATVMRIPGIADMIRSLPPYSRVITDISFALNRSAIGLRAMDFRCVNIAIHILSGLLLYGVVRRTLALPRFGQSYAGIASWLAAASSVLWVVHPLQTESVTYVCQRYESLMGFFYLLSVYCFVRGAGGSRARWWYDGAIAACLLGMGTKEVMATAPVMILLYDYVFTAEGWRRLLRERWKVHIGLMSGWAVLGLLRLVSGEVEAGAGMSATEGNSSIAYLLTQSKVVLYYVRLALWPHPLCLDYGWKPVGSVREVLFPAIAIALVGAVTVLAVWRRRPIGFLSAWFFVVLLPTSSVVAVDDVIFEHRTYLSLAGLLVLVVVGAYHLAGKAFSGRAELEHARTCAWGAVATAIIAASVAATIMRNRTYRSQEAMWRDVVDKQPGNIRAHLGLGTALAQTGRWAEGEICFRRIIDTAGRKPEAVASNVLCLALNNMGTIRERERRYEDAERCFKQALEIRPNYAEGRCNLGIALSRLGRWDEAESEWLAVLRKEPGNISAHHGLASLAVFRKENGEAVRHFALALDSQEPRADAKLS